MAQQPEVDGVNHSPEDISAIFFKRQKPILKALLRNMSVKQIKRTIMYVASYPFSDPGDLPNTEEERRAVHLFNEMINERMVMQLAEEMRKFDEAEQKLKQEQENGKEENSNR